MATIHSKYIQRYQLSDEPNIFTQYVNDSNFRILEISDHDNSDGNESLLRIKGDRIEKLLIELGESSNLFFVTIQTKDEHFDKVFCEAFRKYGKCFLIEICHGAKDIVRYILNGESIEKLMRERLTDFFDCVDESLLISLLSSSVFDNLKNITRMSSPLHSILIRLVKACDSDIACPEDVEKKILENLVSCSNYDCLRAFLDLPVIDDGESIKHTTLTTRAVHYKYRRGATLLFFAANGDVNMLKLLLRLGADVNAENLLSETASDYTKENFKNLMVLLEHDAKFPRNFHQIYAKSLVDCSDGILQKIREIFEERQKLHEAIVDKNEKFIDSFEEKYPLLKFAYTFSDKPPASRAATTKALITANKEGDFTTYLHLIGKGFCVNDNELYFMTKADKNKVSAIILNRLKTEQPSHVTFLSGKTFVYGIGVSQLREYKDTIVRIYQRLNEFSELASILKIVEHSKSLTVSVDFRNKSVMNLDMNASNTMDGLTYHNLGRIYLSVADKDDTEIGGLIIHELTHLALHIIFNNHGCPYHKFDTDRETIFEKIVKKVNEFRKNLPQVVNDVYVSYSKSSWPKELIARVPQLISMGLTETRCEGMNELFQFYRDNVLEYMDTLTRNPEDFYIKREVNQLNEFLRHAEEIEKWNIELNRTCLDQAVYDGRNGKKVICNMPRLFLTDFYNEVVKKSLICTPTDRDDNREYSENYVIFASIEDFESPSTTTYLQRVWNLTSNITLVLDAERFNILEPEFRTLLVKLRSELTSKNIIVFGPDRGAVDSILDAHNQCFILEYTWKHLKKCYRNTLLSKEINFQGVMVPLNKLIDDEFGSIPMKKLVYSEEIVIAKLVDDHDEETFVERNFKYHEGECTASEALSLTSKLITSFLLSGFPGSGQTTVMSRIAMLLKNQKQSPPFWVTRVNLEQLILASEETTDTELFVKHFVSTSCSTEDEFELNLFKRLYDKSEVIFLFDSFVDLPDDCVERALSLVKKLSEKSQLWITIHADSLLKKKLEGELSDKIVLELQPLSWSDHVSCVTKIWRKQLHFDSGNENIFQSCATKLLQFYRHFIGLPKLTSIIANKYLTCVNEYITQNGDMSFIPENILTNKGVIDIYDLHKDLYSEKLHRRHQLATNESAAAIILGMNMFTAFEQFADHCLEINERDDRKPLFMYANGADDLIRNGIINNKFELSQIGTGSYFFLSNYIVKSMESSFKVYGRLCDVIASKHYKLIKFIDGRMKDSTLFYGIDISRPSFTQKYNDKYTKLQWNDIMYLLNEDTILLLCFILEFPSTKREECFAECSIFGKASEKGLRCVIEILWNISNEKFIKYLAQVDCRGCNPFQYAFMNFPQNDVDVIRDTTKAFELSGALRSEDEFIKELNKPTHEKYQNSTLHFYANKILSYNTDEERNTFIYKYSRPLDTYEYRISSKHFDESIERKWMVMTQLNFPITDWTKLTTKTIFENVIHIIFNEFNNSVVMQFYKWAETKVTNVDTFNTFVADTFVNYFWNCSSVRHGKDIITFVRDKINIEEVLTQRGIKVFNKKFDNKIAMYRSLFTKKEFEIFLFHKPGNGCENNKDLITKICESLHEETIYETFAAAPLDKIIEHVEINWKLAYALMLYMVGRLDELRDDAPIKYITDFIGKQKRDLISDVLCTATNEGFFFSLAFIRRDMFMKKLVWDMVKTYLGEEQIRCLLLDPYNVFPKLVGNVTTDEFLYQPPSINNTNCQTACFEFISFELNGVVAPKFAVAFNDKNQIFIGRCKLLNTYGFVLCKIMFNKPDPIEVIEFSGVQPLKNSLEILIGKGLLWIKHTDKKQLYFRFKQKLLKKHNDNVLLVDETCVGDYFLAYDDAAARGSEMVNGFCYYQGRKIGDL